MAGSENLIGHGFETRTAEERRENARKAGRASGKSRAKKRDLKRALELLLEKKYTDANGNTITGTEAITTKLFQQAMKGNVKAFETIRATVGQDPVQKIMVAEVDPAVVDEVERAVLGE